eukprot:8426189-Pyramimonas_sp.AAC.2
MEVTFGLQVASKIGLCRHKTQRSCNAFFATVKSGQSGQSVLARFTRKQTNTGVPNSPTYCTGNS